MFPDLQEKYLVDPRSGSCPFFKAADEFIFDRTPEKDDFYHLMYGKFCGEAWDAINRYVYAAWTRPVIFKIERIDIPENPDEKEWLAGQNFRNTAEDAYTG